MGNFFQNHEYIDSTNNVYTVPKILRCRGDTAIFGRLTEYIRLSTTTPTRLSAQCVDSRKSLMGLYHEILDLWFFPSNNSICLFEYGFEFADIIDHEIADLVVSGVNDTADRW
jgi:hypothetical protein